MNNILSEKQLLNIITKNNIPKSIKKYLDINNQYNFNYSNEAYSLYIKEKELYLKIGKNLEQEMLNTIYLNKKGLSQEIIEFAQDENYDYLLIKDIKGENGIQKKYLENPKKLAEHFGTYLRKIHSIKCDDSPDILIMEEFINQARENVANRAFNIQSFFKNNGFTPQKALLILEDLKSCYINDAYLHGDYRLENVIMDDFDFKGLVGLDKCGIGDRHYDICCGLNSLKKNLKTREYNERFLESYGYNEIDKDRLIFCKVLTILS